MTGYTGDYTSVRFKACSNYHITRVVIIHPALRMAHFGEI